MINIIFKDKAQRTRKRAFANETVARDWLANNSHWAKYINMTKTVVITKKKLGT